MAWLHLSGTATVSGTVSRLLDFSQHAFTLVVQTPGLFVVHRLLFLWFGHHARRRVADQNRSTVVLNGMLLLWHYFLEANVHRVVLLVMRCCSGALQHDAAVCDLVRPQLRAVHVLLLGFQTHALVVGLVNVDARVNSLVLL